MLFYSSYSQFDDGRFLHNFLLSRLLVFHTITSAHTDIKRRACQNSYVMKIISYETLTAKD